MGDNYNLKLYFKKNAGEGVELCSYQEENNGKVITQWLLTPRTKDKSQFFLSLFDQDDRCIDAKYISEQTKENCIEYWTHNYE